MLNNYVKVKNFLSREKSGLSALSALSAMSLNLYQKGFPMPLQVSSEHKVAK